MLVKDPVVNIHGPVKCGLDNGHAVVLFINSEPYIIGYVVDGCLCPGVYVEVHGECVFYMRVVSAYLSDTMSGYARDMALHVLSWSMYMTYGSRCRYTIPITLTPLVGSYIIPLSHI